ncbi:hypothetical protein [Glaciihabitans sp. UYNi722]|uniref:hypothetical protein n=1 Tax=Glaciihabitans sp. UYNi722 TaxID=3156344 RepID=UPI00339A4622
MADQTTPEPNDEPEAVTAPQTRPAGTVPPATSQPVYQAPVAAAPVASRRSTQGLALDE